ncbi:hypothetical protein [Marinactinospora rubrisoli]|uniref:DUF3558 domain-containing protein n=1 Tax=Marinactinospora rubrisoli TaxID=2715399 RepID=A0ABW2KC44_9ACTN
MALLTVGGVVGIVNALTRSVDPSAGPRVSPSWQAVESVDPGEFDLCGQTVDTLGVTDYRLDDGAGYEDTATSSPSARPRVVSDECAWEITSAAAGKMEMAISYEVFIAESGEETGSDFAQRSFEEMRASLSDQFETIVDEGERSDVIPSSYYVYGSAIEDEGALPRYVFLGRVKSGVFRIVLQDIRSSPSEALADESAFLAELRGIVPDVQIDLERRIPD